MTGRDLVLLLIGIVVILFGVFLVVIFWHNFLDLLAGIVGTIIFIVGLVLLYVGASSIKNTIKK